jgi:hypothetical protein
MLTSEDENIWGEKSDENEGESKEESKESSIE